MTTCRQGEREYPARGSELRATHWGNIEASHQGEREHPARGSELRATYRGSKKVMLPVGGTNRQAAKESEDTLLGGNELCATHRGSKEAVLLVEGARKPFCQH